MKNLLDLDFSRGMRWQVFGVDEDGTVERWADISSQSIQECGLGSIIDCGDWNFLLVETPEGLTSFRLYDDGFACPKLFSNTYGLQFIEGKPRRASFRVEIEEFEE